MMQKDVEIYMKKSENKNKRQESTIFSDPKKGKEEIAKKHKGLWWKVTAVVLVLLVGIPWLIVELNKDDGSKKTPMVSFSTRVQRTEVHDEGREIYAAKNPDINDLEADKKLLELLKIEEMCGEFTVEVSSKKEPYRLTLVFAEPHDKSRDDWFENTMVGYACVLLATIQNADEIGWTHPDNGSGDNGGYFTKDDVEEFLGIKPSMYGSSEKALQLLLNDTGVFPY